MEMMQKVADLRAEIEGFAENFPVVESKNPLEALLGVKALLFADKEKSLPILELGKKPSFYDVRDEKWDEVPVDICTRLARTVIGLVLATGAGWVFASLFAYLSSYNWIHALVFTGLNFVFWFGYLMYWIPFGWYKKAKEEVRGENQAALNDRECRMNEWKDKLGTDTRFFIVEVKKLLENHIKRFHEEASRLQGQFEQEAIKPREKARGLIQTLHGMKDEALKKSDDDLPNKEAIIAEIDQGIEKCEKVISKTHPQEGEVVRLLQSVRERLADLYKYPAMLDALRRSYESQQNFMDRLKGVLGEVREIEAIRQNALHGIARNLRELRADMGLVLNTISDFQKSLPGITLPALPSSTSEN